MQCYFNDNTVTYYKQTSMGAVRLMQKSLCAILLLCSYKRNSFPGVRKGTNSISKQTGYTGIKPFGGTSGLTETDRIQLPTQLSAEVSV